jgi:hypothetical protein
VALGTSRKQPGFFGERPRGALRAEIVSRSIPLVVGAVIQSTPLMAPHGLRAQRTDENAAISATSVVHTARAQLDHASDGLTYMA